MAEDVAQGADNVSVEPSLEEQIAVWRDKYLRLQAEFDNFRKRTIKEKMDLDIQVSKLKLLKRGHRGFTSG